MLGTTYDKATYDYARCVAVAICQHPERAQSVLETISPESARAVRDWLASAAGWLAKRA